MDGIRRAEEVFLVEVDADEKKIKTFSLTFLFVSSDDLLAIFSLFLLLHKQSAGSNQGRSSFALRTS